MLMFLFLIVLNIVFGYYLKVQWVSLFIINALLMTLHRAGIIIWQLNAVLTNQSVIYSKLKGKE
jgi:hypothetical protein